MQGGEEEGESASQVSCIANIPNHPPLFSEEGGVRMWFFWEGCSGLSECQSVLQWVAVSLSVRPSDAQLDQVMPSGPPLKPKSAACFPRAYGGLEPVPYHEREETHFF